MNVASICTIPVTTFGTSQLVNFLVVMRHTFHACRSNNFLAVSITIFGNFHITIFQEYNFDAPKSVRIFLEHRKHHLDPSTDIRYLCHI